MDGLRAEIDRLDRAILDLLNRRAALALEIGRVKLDLGKPVFDPDRERRLIAGLVRDNGGPLSDTVVTAVFSEIVSGCRALQQPLKVCYLGPEATYSHAAALKYFGRGPSAVPLDSVEDVFREVESGRADFGVAPVENSTEGVVGLTLDRFTTSDLSVCGEICLDVRHTLLSRAESLDSIKKVVSHPQALAQCRQWLAANLPSRPTVVAASTAAAAAEAAGDPTIAAVGGAMLADMYGLNVLAEGIQDRPVNVTRFLVLGRKLAARTGQDKTSIWFVAPHRPGALHGALECLAAAGLNLTRIESRPARVGVWQYVFFADFEGHVEDEAVKSALEKLSGLVEKVCILGSYPRDNGVHPHPGGGA